MQCDFDRNLPNFFDGLEIGDTTLADGRRIEADQIPEYNVEGLRPTIEIQHPTIDTTISGAISLNLDEFSCLEADQMPQNVRQSLMSVPDESQLPPPDSQSSMRKKRELTDRWLYYYIIYTCILLYLILF